MSNVNNSNNPNPTRAFYNKFFRHAQGAGVKGYSNHYCPGCGHGVAQKYLAESISELGIQDKTITVSPVGCSVFMYYYMDTGNTQAAHGRASVTALGHKFANPGSVVISYQGDGDLASIGLAEIVSTAQLGIPITVIFINNAIYGMTGGQMAPTTLMGQRTSTSPNGRQPIMGAPFKIAELISNLDGPVYVERVALFNAKERTKAKKAIKKGLKLQMENKGFSFIEVLAECPTHLKISALESEKWVQEKMLPMFPLGVKKDLFAEGAEAGAGAGTGATHTNNFNLTAPTFDAKKVFDIVTGGNDETVPRYAKGVFPKHLDPKDVSMKLAGSGGDGAQTAAMLIAQSAINEGHDATHIPSYGPESRGGTSYADIHVAAEEVLSPASPTPQILIAFNGPSLMKFGPTVANGGIIIYDSSVVTNAPSFKQAKVYGVPFAEIAVKLGNAMVKNIVALGALQAASKLYPEETFLTAVKTALKSKPKFIEVNEKAFREGMKAIH
ncbi:MAG: 2-oxoacid:acceptor oxidoreductase family protein [Oligoflexia bacterium]|nr:2-oxoacid:acceptor oxidoreductase family protein [Oligoflexia bacterium]